MLRAARVLAALLLVLCAPLHAAAKWTTLRSPNFVFVGDASERQIRDVAQQLEKFRDVVARLLPGAATSPAPTVVFVFATDQSFRSYTPRFNGRSVEVGGYFVGGDDVNYIAVNAEQRAFALTTVFHEYTHFMAANSRAALPVWAGEGLAEVYESYQERDGGRRAVIGIPAKHQVDLLRGSTLMPLAQLLAVDHQSPMYNEGSRRSVFYAQSWALMHYLMLGSPARTAQLRGYLGAIRTGTAPQQAFRDAFGADDSVLERELFEYVRQFTFPAVQYTFDEKTAGAVSARGSTIDDAEAQGYLGDLVARLGRRDDARALLRAAMAARPRAIRPAVALALLELREGKLNEAMPLLEAAVSRGADDAGAHAALGRALIEQLRTSQTGGPARDTLLERARSVLSRAMEIDPTVAQTVAMLASVELTSGNTARATTLIEQAVRQAPAHEQYRLMAAEALIRQREFDRATTYLGPLVASGSRQSVRDTARQLLVSAARQRVASEVAPQGAPGPSPPTTTSLPVTLAGFGAEPPPPARMTLDLRPVLEGETRVLGVFRAMECGQSGIAIVIDVEGRTLRLGAQKFEQVDFITYRSDQPGNVACGAQPGPGRVLATYRSNGQVSGSSDGIAVAIELLPDGYVPR